MSDERVFRTLGPFPLDVDRAVLSWLGRESAGRALAAEGYELVEHVEREVPVSELPPKTVKHALQHGIDPSRHLWVEQITTGRVNRPLLDWLIAECKWTNEQIKTWLGAERSWKARNA